MLFVYVLSSDIKDFYTEQTAISIYSLRLYNPDAYVVLLCDDTTYDYLKKSNNILIDLCDEIKTVYVPETFTSMQKSRFLKTSARAQITGDFAYIDSDTVITGSLEELKTFNGEIGMVKQQDSDDWNRLNPHSHLKSYNIAYCQQENYSYGIDVFYNGGFFVCKDTELAHQFFERWHERWIKSSTFYNFNMDQPDLWITNAEFNHIIEELPGQYNCMAICYNIALRYLADCKIFHYFSSSRHCNYLKFRNPEYLKRFRQDGFTNDTVEAIKNVKKEYLDGLDIKDKELYDKIQTQKLVKIAQKVSEKLPVINKLLDKSYNLYEYFISKKNRQKGH